MVMDAPRRTIIRPSSLVSYGDCPRRAVAGMLRREVEEAGFELKRSLNSIAASVGTSVHAGAARVLEEKMSGDTGPGALAAAEQASLDTLAQQVAQGIGWDDKSPNLDTAQKQVIRMVRSYNLHLAPKITPVAVEERLEADAGDGFVVSGQSDAMVREPDWVRDLKSGLVSRTHAAQLGAYCMLQHSHGRTVRGAAVDFIKRVPLSKEQPPPESTEYGLDDVVQVARYRIERIKREVTEFRRRLEDGDAAPEWAFDCNSASMLCTEKYCSAYGTSFCREWTFKEKTS